MLESIVSEFAKFRDKKRTRLHSLGLSIPIRNVHFVIILRIRNHFSSLVKRILEKIQRRNDLKERK